MSDTAPAHAAVSDGPGDTGETIEEQDARSRHPSHPLELADDVAGVIAERMLALADPPDDER